MDISILRDFIISNEGNKLKVYTDSVGVKTIGVGFNLERGDAQTRISALGINFESILAGKVSLTPEQSYQLLDWDLNSAIEDAMVLFKNFSSLNLERQTVLVDMAFNLGRSRLSSFVKLRAAVEAKKWEVAANEMQNSTWATQVGYRAIRNIDIMRTGQFNSNLYDKPKEKKLLNGIKNFFRKIFGTKK